MQLDIFNVNPCSVESGWNGFAKWTFPILSGMFVLITFLLTYWYNLNVRAGDLLLKLEEAFTKLGSNLAFLEYKTTCYDPVKDIFRKCNDNVDSLTERERKTLEDMDACIRFLFICTIHAGNRVCPAQAGWLKRKFFPSRVPKAYYYYLNRLNDQELRPELYDYVRKFFPTMEPWLKRNKEALTTYLA
jgi:hypothetical protein